MFDTSNSQILPRSHLSSHWQNQIVNHESSSQHPNTFSGFPCRIIVGHAWLLRYIRPGSSTPSKDDFFVPELLTEHLQICSDIRQLIDSSSELQYAIDIQYFNAIPASLPSRDVDVASRRQLLRKSETAWQKAEYTQRYSIPMSYRPDNYRWSCGTLGVPAKSLAQIKFVQPTLSDKNTQTTDLRQRNCKIDSIAFEGYSFSPAQDLVAILSRSAPG